MRLDYYLSHAGFGTRKEVKKLIKDRAVHVNHEIVSSPSFIVQEAQDEITVHGQKVHYQPFHYFLLNKPQGYLSATEDAHFPTVLHLIHEPIPGLFPVGRLDKDTTGLLLITNHGKLAHFLLSPKSHVEKEYRVQVDHPLREDLPSLFKQGVVLDDGDRCLPATLTIIDDHQAFVILHEGKYHQIKRMFETFGYHVMQLERIRMGNLYLKGIEQGTYRPLTAEEIAELLRHMR